MNYEQDKEITLHAGNWTDRWTDRQKILLWSDSTTFIVRTLYAVINQMGIYYSLSCDLCVSVCLCLSQPDDLILTHRKVNSHNDCLANWESVESLPNGVRQ